MRKYVYRKIADAGMARRMAHYGHPFGCYLCGHRFVEGDEVICLYSNHTSAHGNPLICKDCDTEGALDKWVEQDKLFRTKFWYVAEIPCEKLT